MSDPIDVTPDDLRRMLAEATPLPWSVDDVKDAIYGPDESSILKATHILSEDPNSSRDIDLACAAANVLPAYLDRIAALEHENARLRKAGEKLAEACGTLRDEQNGPPLIRDAPRWCMAMEQTRLAIDEWERAARPASETEEGGA